MASSEDTYAESTDYESILSNTEDTKCVDYYKALLENSPLFNKVICEKALACLRRLPNSTNQKTIQEISKRLGLSPKQVRNVLMPKLLLSGLSTSKDKSEQRSSGVINTEVTEAKGVTEDITENKTEDMTEDTTEDMTKVMTEEMAQKISEDVTEDITCAVYNISNNKKKKGAEAKK
ncbi:uncharacterized protein LOC119682921 [Teleopsis dalmanni]|uniref:uncharacterized protein LOC119682921 n=1 Tax=Teleopsis dalmanni TaxID=139649 RepID=UPI0018CE47E3|nr:uncharacterized protein LOC119682921 [Teleopsis dalmanni]XP_037952399.1 uncharacterized protein LOC119682921 [Teleopsis dalmanni]